MSKFLNIKVASKDPVVKTAQAGQLARKGQWTQKSSTAAQCQEIFQSLSEECFIPTVQNKYVLDTAIRYELPKRRKAATAKNKEKLMEKGKKSSLRLKVQGDLAKTI